MNTQVAPEGPPTVLLSTVVHLLLQNAYTDLQKLSTSLRHKESSDKKFNLTKYFKKWRVQFVRLLVLVKWAKQVEDIKRGKNLVSHVQSHDASFERIANEIFDLRSNYLKDAKMAIYDIPSSVDVLVSGSYERLPRFMRTVKLINGQLVVDPLREPELQLTDDKIDDVILRLNHELSIRLLATDIPICFSDIKIDGGKLFCTVENEFKVILTLLDGIGPDAPWTVLELDILVTPEGVVDYVGVEFENRIREIARDRMVTAERPFFELYEVVHSFCITLYLSILKTQVEALRLRKRGTKIVHIEYEEDAELCVYFWKPNIELEQNKDVFFLKYFISRTNELVAEIYPKFLTNEYNGEKIVSLNPTTINIENDLKRCAKLQAINVLDYLQRELRKSNDFEVTRINLPTKNILRMNLLGNYTVTIFIDLHTGNIVIKPSTNELKEQVKKLTKSLNENMRNISHISMVLKRNIFLLGYRKSCSEYPLVYMPRLWFVSDEIIDLINSYEICDVYELDIKMKSLSFYVVINSGEEEAEFKLLITKDVEDENELVLHQLYTIFIDEYDKKISVNIRQVNNEPTPKRRRIGYRKHGYQNLYENRYMVIDKLVSICRKKVQSLMILNAMDENEIFYEKIDDKNLPEDMDEGYLFQMDFYPLNIERALLYFYNDFASWKVVLVERERLFHDIHYSEDKVLVEHSEMYYCSQEQSWYFNYASIHKDSFKVFLEYDYHGLYNCFSVVNDFKSKNWKDFIFAEPGFDENAIFEINEISPNTIKLNYGFENEMFDTTVSIECRKNCSVEEFYKYQTLEIKGYHYMKYIINCELKENPNMEILIKYIVYTIRPMDLIFEIANQCSFEDNIKWRIIPKNLFTVRVLCEKNRKFIGYDLRFAPYGLVSIEDATYIPYGDNLRPDIIHPITITPIPGFKSDTVHWTEIPKFIHHLEKQ
eukprot:TRINITY_DN11635_c0_g1_i1.p1 TRINITY_DN11635_c0_g1~~TRINITY_DN11635_c0_g1_i1.p1  ORF type:complete len:940 (-),score=171.97 TRINITY_DN11635_c0_g1_i1:122-2941(-)